MNLNTIFKVYYQMNVEIDVLKLKNGRNSERVTFSFKDGITVFLFPIFL